MSDSAACTMAAVTHAAAAGADTSAPPPVFLLRVGTDRLIAFNFTSVGEFTLFVLLDEQLNFLDRLFG